jgi:hypothetical protein
VVDEFKAKCSIYKVHTKLSPKAEANFRKVKEFMARKSKFVRAEEFAGKGKTIEILDVDTEDDGKLGPSVQIKLSCCWLKILVDKQDNPSIPIKNNPIV